ncbi:hypothetical protein E3N88_32419 [Mikania micrantha]|uniref:Uncharacterized protein n=1 Tax=Mikania micrantha TaxID=192012 RepID=A0A5N6M8H6_9ASTR|nr:hypothetical protein E3N88_32419 [Mikania micrantha]
MTGIRWPINQYENKVKTGSLVESEHLKKLRSTSWKAGKNFSTEVNSLTGLCRFFCLRYLVHTIDTTSSHETQVKRAQVQPVLIGDGG